MAEQDPATPFLNTYGASNGMPLAEILQIETDKMLNELKTILESPVRTHVDLIVAEHQLCMHISVHLATLRLKLGLAQRKREREERNANPQPKE